MDDNQTTETVETEVVASPEKVGVSLRDSLSKNFDSEDEAQRVEPTAAPTSNAETTEEAEKIEAKPTSTERVPVAPPADMNKEEREAFLNPTSENNHVLQRYLSRRAHETRADYQRQTAELEQTKQKVGALYQAVSEYEKDYARDGINIADVTKRSIEWDLAMKANPTQTALEYIDAYGLTLNDLVYYVQQGGYQQPQQEQQSYLTAADAERIAQEKIDTLLRQQQESVIAQNHYNAVQSFISSKPLFKDPGTAQQLEDAMEPIVAALSQRGGNPQEILETAYEYVTRGNPTFSALRTQFEAPQVVEQTLRTTQKAKAASRSISGSTGSGTPRLKATSLRDNLQRRFTGAD